MKKEYKKNFIDVSNKIEKFIEDLKKIDNDKVESLIKVIQAAHNKAKKINQELNADIQLIVKQKQELLCDLNEINLAIEQQIGKIKCNNIRKF